MLLNNRSSVSRAIHHILILGAGTAAVSAVDAQLASAQEQPPSASSAPEEVVVTGSIIKRADFDTPSPLQVLTSEDLLQSGHTSVSEVLRNLSANGQGTLSQSFSQAFAGGGSGIALPASPWEAP
jgi:iron complex outermembrane receptor protein